MVLLELFCRILQPVSLLWIWNNTLTVPAFFRIIGAPPGCSDKKLVTSYTCESSTIQQSFFLVCFATSAPSMCPMFPSLQTSRLLFGTEWPTTEGTFEGRATPAITPIFRREGRVIDNRSDLSMATHQRSSNDARTWNHKGPGYYRENLMNKDKGELRN